MFGLLFAVPHEGFYDSYLWEINWKNIFLNKYIFAF